MHQGFAFQVIFSFIGLIMVSADVVQLCKSRLAVQRGYCPDVESYRTVQYVRSVVECATLCHAEVECQSAVYKGDNKCHLIAAGSTISVQPISSHNTNDYLVGPEGHICPSTCDGDSVCVLDCSDDTAISEAICADLSGIKDGCNFSPVTQLKEYYLAGLDEASSTDDHIFFTVTFEKLFQSTVLKVKFRGTLRGGFGAVDSYAIWEIKFDGNSCTSPGKIQSGHTNKENDVSHHRASGIQGICEGLNKGSVEITLTAFLHLATAQVGYLTDASRLYVEEFEQPGNVVESVCPSLSLFNIREEIMDLATSDYSETVPIWNVVYRKMEDNTSLKMNMDFVIRMSTSTDKCVMWSLLINGNECQPVPFGKILAHLNGAQNVQNEHRSVEVEGYCHDVGAGLVEISLYVGSCDGSTLGLDGVYTGWSGVSQRIIIEEYRTESSINSVMAPDGETLYRLPQMNVVTFGAFHLDSNIDKGVVWNLGNYRKLYANSGLRLSMSSDARAQTTSEECCRFFFMIGNAECSNPGPIEGIISINVYIYLHRPILIEGICEGISAGDTELSVHVGHCKDQPTVANCHFSRRSYDHVMASEVYAEREIVHF